MEEGDASGTGIWDPVTKTWSENLMNIISDDLASKLPIVSSATKSIGYISNSLANQYGFDLECRIDAGSGDNMYSALGTGNIEPGIVTISLGTSGTNNATIGVFFGGWAGGRSDVIQKVTIATTGNATDFGDLSTGRHQGGALAGAAS